MYTIYVIENQESHKKYVGQTQQDLRRRWSQHCCRSTHSEIGNAIKEHGKEAFTIYAVDTANTQEESDEKERYWIKNLNTLYPFGYNRNSGGTYGACPCEDVVQRISHTKRSRPLSEKAKAAIERNRGKYKGANSPLYGKPKSPEHREKLRQALLGKGVGPNNPNYGNHWSEEQKEVARQRSIECFKTHCHPDSSAVVCIETGKVYYSGGEASRDTGATRCYIYKICKRSHGTSAGYHWRYATEEEEKTLTRQKLPRKKDKGNAIHQSSMEN